MSKLKADQLYEKALKKSKTIIIPYIMDKEKVYSETAQLYQNAGHLYKKNNHRSSAIDSYLNAAKYYEMIRDNTQAIICYEDVANLYENKENAITVYLHLIELFKTEDKDINVAKTYIRIGNIYEEIGDIQNMIDYYQMAIQVFERNNVDCNKYILKLADIMALRNDYQNAIKLYEKLTKKYLNTISLKYQIKKTLYKSTLCHLIYTPMTEFNVILKNYVELDPNFYVSLEYKLVYDISKLYENYDFTKFQNILSQHDRLIKFDAWELTLLNRIKKRFEDYSLV